MIIQSSINCPTVICLPTVCYFSREKPLVKPTAPGSLLQYICFQDLFCYSLFSLFATFIFRSIFPKTQKYLAAIYSYLFYLVFDLSNYYNSLTSVCQFLAPLPKRDCQPL